MFLLDTDALSEMEKPKPDAGLLSWMESVDWLDLHLSVITVAEVRLGISRLPDGQKRRALEAMFELLPDRFYNRILPVDFSIAVKYGEIQASSGPLPSMDRLIAATAIVRRLTVVTRNGKDIMRTGASVFDPWSGK
jgi:predicted nucleic acid-binding protein